MTKLLSDLKPWDVKRIDAMFMQHGTERYGIEQVARSFSLTESAAGAMATAIKERNAPKPVTESAPAAAVAPDDAARYAGASQKAALAFKLQAQVQAAEAKPLSECSLQELQSLTAAAATEAGMFGA